MLVREAAVHDTKVTPKELRAAAKFHNPLHKRVKARPTPTVDAHVATAQPFLLLSTTTFKKDP